MHIDFEKLSPTEIYHLMTQSIIPRPIAWVISENEGGSHNLAPFSYFNGIGSSPPLIMISVGVKSDGTKKDTLRNIEERSHFVLNIATVDQLSQVQKSATPLAYGESEIEAQKLEITQEPHFPLPRLTHSPISFFCQKEQILEIGNTPQRVIFGRISSMYAKNQITGKDHKGRLVLDPMKINPLTRLGANYYGQLNGSLPAEG